MIYFMSVLNNEYIKVGYTGRVVDKRKDALQTGNPHKIEVLFYVEGSLKQEQKIHGSLKRAFERVKVFDNPTNEWYLGKNPIIKTLMSSIKRFGVEHAIKIINNINHWKKRVKKDEVFTIRSLERALRNSGISKSMSKKLISQNKAQIVSKTCGKTLAEVINQIT